MAERRDNNGYWREVAILALLECAWWRTHYCARELELAEIRRRVQARYEAEQRSQAAGSDGRLEAHTHKERMHHA